MSIVIAIDGPSASGKSTVSREVARKLNWIHVDSGAVYRGLTQALLERGIDVSDSERIMNVLPALKIEFFLVAGQSIQSKIDNVSEESELRSSQVNESVSLVAAIPEVRARVTECLRGLVSFGNLVMEGRDIGTVIFPDAQYKFYLDAAPSERARRRQKEQNKSQTLSEVAESLSKRDSHDSTRSAAPLRTATDARVLDTTNLSIAEVVSLILKAL